MTDHPIRQTPDELREQAETDMHAVLPAEPEQDDTPSRRAGLRGEIARAIHRYDRDHLLSRSAAPSKDHQGEADAVLALLYRAWPWLRAEAEDAAATEATELATTARITDLCDRWVKAGPPPLGTSLARWWDRRLAELHNTIHPPAPETEQNTTTKEN